MYILTKYTGTRSRVTATPVQPIPFVLDPRMYNDWLDSYLIVARFACIEIRFLEVVVCKLENIFRNGDEDDDDDNNDDFNRTT